MMERETRKVLDLRKGYTIDEVVNSRDGKIITISSTGYHAENGRRAPYKGRLALLVVAVGFASAIALAALSGANAADSPAENVPHSAVLTPEPTMQAVETIAEAINEADMIEAALIAQGYFRDDVPLNYELQDVLHSACEANGIPYHVALGLIETESGFDPDAVSSAGCYGLTQLNPEYFPSDLAPSENITAGMEFLGYQLERYDGDMEAALTAYNAGHDTGARWYAEAVLEKAEKWRTNK